jgi:serine/threonine-protein phosphatase 6 regulatory ankyrin repeat subunit B
MDTLLPYLDEEDINLRDFDGNTSLMYTARSGCLYCSESLIISGANIDETSSDGSTALIFAALYGNMEVLETLISRGANQNVKTDKGGTVLHCACFAGHIDVVKYLLKNTDIDVNTKDNTDCSSLMYAVLYNRVDVLSVLVEHGANVNDEKTGYSALFYAARKGSFDSINILINFGANIHFVDKEGNSILHFAALTEDNITCICLLIELGADRLVLNTNGETFVDVKNDTYDDNFLEIIDSELKIREQVRRDMIFNRRKDFMLFLYGCSYLQLFSKKYIHNKNTISYEEFYYHNELNNDNSENDTVIDTVFKSTMLIRKIASYL